MIRSSRYVIPAAFFLAVNFSISSVKPFFITGLIYFFFLIFLFGFLRRFDLKKIIKSTIGGISVIIFLYGILQKYILFPFYLANLKPGNDYYSQALVKRIESGRVFSLFTLPTLYAIICSVLIIFIFHYLWKADKWKIFWGALLVLGLFNLLLVQSFGGIAYLTAGFLVYFFLSGILNLKYLGPAIMTLSFFFFVITGLRFSEAKELEPVKLRFSHWKQAARMIHDHPLWGVGLGNYQSNISLYEREGEARSIYTHNFFIQFIAEVGLLFFSFIIIMLIWLRKNLKIAPDGDKPLYLSVFIILILYNVIDIGFYFFSAGIIGVVTLSQLYQCKDGKYRTSLLFLTVFSLLLCAVNGSDYLQKKGEFHLNQKNFAASEKFLAGSLKINPYNYNALVEYAQLNLYQDKVSKAQKYIDRALQIYDNSGFCNYLKSKLDYNSGRLLSSLHYAYKAFMKNRKNNHYRLWYEFIKTNLQSRIS